MTKVTILGQEEVKKEKKKIEFIKVLNGHKLEEVNLASCSPSSYLNVELICKALSDSYYDTMFAYDNVRSKGCIYLGHFNDGEV